MKKEILQVFEKNPKKLYNYKQISTIIGIKKKNRTKVINILKELKEEKKIKEESPGRYKLIPGSQYYVTGIVDMTSTGAAYVVSEQFEEDIFISPNFVSNALHGDKVKVFVFENKKNKKKLKGEIIEILKRRKTQFTGIVEVSKNFAFLIPDDKKMHVNIYIPLKHLNGANNGDKAIAKITSWPQKASSPFGEIVEILGKAGEHDVEIHSIMAEYGLPMKFDKTVENAANKINSFINKDEIKKRLDFRNVTTFTIDPADAKDFDDALSFKKINDNLFEIGIHIADVTHYVKEKTILDEEAYKRATSVYLVDKVVPMLPEKLSNNICSILPNEDRLCFSVIVNIDLEGNIKSKIINKTIINSNKRFTYDEVQEILEKKEGTFVEELLILKKISQNLRKKRIKNGAINFDKVEVKFNLDERGRPVGIYFKHSKEAHQLIEEFMLLANKIVAEFIGKHEKTKTFVYRVHDLPPKEKLLSFSDFVKKLGYNINFRNEKEISKTFNKLLDEVKGKAEQDLIVQLAIKSMSKAYYSTKNIGHYGLAFSYYTHFTSPIRRYPDILVHRLLKRYMENKKSTSAKLYEKKCKHCSEMEQIAQNAEWDSIKLKQVEYMLDNVYRTYKGIITGVTEWGIFVEINENKCEGLVRMHSLKDDFYILDEDNYRIIGKRTKNIYRLGDKVLIRVIKVDLKKRQLDFEMITKL